MILTDEERKKINDFLEKNWASPQNCSVCHKNSWNISPEVFELRSFHGGSMVIGGKSGIVPLILITCDNCGNTIFINALIAGLDLKGGTK
jgi:hypothetical protein